MLDPCNGLLPVIRIIRKRILPLVYVVIPILLMVFAVLDFGKCVIAGDDKEIKQAQGVFFKRVVNAAIIFFIPWFVTVIMDFISTGVTDGSTTGWQACWLAAKE